MDELADKVIDALQESGEMPKPHKAAMLVVGVMAGFLAKDAAQKVYKTAYKAYQVKKASA
jgi:hypothetical protein